MQHKVLQGFYTFVKNNLQDQERKVYGKVYGTTDFYDLSFGVSNTAVRGFTDKTPTPLYIRSLRVKASANELARVYILQIDNTGTTAQVIDYFAVAVKNGDTILENGDAFIYKNKVPADCVLAVGKESVNFNLYASSTSGAGEAYTIETQSLTIGQTYNLIKSLRYISVSAEFTPDNIFDITQEIKSVEKITTQKLIAPVTSMSGKAYNISTGSISTVEAANLNTYENINDAENYYLVSSWKSGIAEYPLVIYFDSSNDVIGSQFTDKLVYKNLAPLTIPSGTTKILVNSRYIDSPCLYTDCASNGLSALANSRQCVINFQCDDGGNNDPAIYLLFKNNGYVCGFALLSTVVSSETKLARYLAYQSEGFEILAHSTSGDIPSTEEPLRLTKAILEANGFHVRGWVTPSHVLPENLKPFLRKYYDFGYTINNATMQNYSTACNLITDSEYNMWRYGLQQNTYSQWISAVDQAIENGGILTFYGHSGDYGDTYPNFNETNMLALFTYLRNKEAAGYCKVLAPSQCYDSFFKIRHDDIMKLL